jgi:hypothetical protein
MGVCKLFFRIAHYLHENPHQLASASLEDIAAQYRPYAYIGARESLHEFVQEQAQEVGIDPAQWFGTKKWQSDSGAFPDFVLACEPHSPLGNGALLELKDSADDQIASFNSTLPSARKRISRLTKMVQTAVQNYESERGCACPDERDCFYLVRTKNKYPDTCRLSVVQGTFFETIPNQELLKSLWKDLLKQAGVPAEQHMEILDYLAKLERNEVAKSRRIERAAIKPRLRIMSEVVADANPHKYQEIRERTALLRRGGRCGITPAEENTYAREPICPYRKTRLPHRPTNPTYLRPPKKPTRLHLPPARRLRHAQNLSQLHLSRP